MSVIASRIAAVVIAVTFSAAAVAKLADLPGWRRALTGYRLSPLVRVIALPAVPIAELIVVTCLLVLSERAAAAATLACLAVFSAAIVRAARPGDRLPCGCFGGGRERDPRTMLVRNAALTICCIAILLGGNESSLVSSIDRSEVVPALLTAVAVGLALWVAAQSNAILFRRPR